jgi:programmed cell death 6-interacting protein
VDEADIRKEESEQTRLLDRVKETNSSFQTARRGDTSSRERETALQNLENAYTSYKEILRNLDTGRKFYNDLAAITTRFRDECRNFVYARRSEAQSMEADLSDAMAGLRIQQSNQANLRQQKAAQEQHTSPPARVVGQEAMPAPMPQRPQAQPPPVAVAQTPTVQTWQEGMPIVFGGPPGGASASAGGQSQQGSRAGSTVDGRWDPSRGVNFGR